MLEFEMDEYSYSDTFSDDYMNTLTPTTPTQVNTRPKGSNKNKNKRRFSDEQIKLLETMFENETRLEPRKKIQLAKDLGLQPRQVAIWFQNKRARWKSKQLEREFGVLRANYNNLASKFESLKKEKQALILQLQKLNEVMKEPRENGKFCDPGNISINYNNKKCDIREFKINIEKIGKIESEVKPSLSIETSDQVLGGGVMSDAGSSTKAEYFEGLEEEPQLMAMVDPANRSFTSQDDWGSLDSHGLFDQPSSECQWWDFWG